MSDIFKAFGVCTSMDAIEYLNRTSHNSQSLDNIVYTEQLKLSSHQLSINYDSTNRRINIGRRYREQGPKY